ncbi:MAG: sulfatase-like hydrolase/transferase [Planctomycetaceae bacterium]|nr:sulfatase-like hydrolase/transferase [Planctomycetaceae bacterium]
MARATSRDDRPNIIVFYTDDHGYADLSCQGVLADIRTPHVDALAASGVRALHGYSTAPQCVPSRAGLLVGRFQARFGVEANGRSLAGFDQQTTIAQRLQSADYITGQFGKWHLGPTAQIPQHGFRYVYAQNSQAPFSANMTLDGASIPMQSTRPVAYHVDACSQAAAAIIRRHAEDPLFLYIAYRAPHVPLDAPPKYLHRFPGEMPQRRRQALAMLSAVDDGVGLVMDTLKELGLRQNTLVFYIGDNGAPLKIHRDDAPGGGPGWDGSLNDPLNGEKGMLSEGGMHTPFVVSWPARFPGGQQYPHPIWALDVAATAAAAAKLDVPAGALDGVDLDPFLSGDNPGPVHDALMWRWVSQSAIREGDWKLLRGGEREYLYNLSEDLEEKHNLAAAHPEIASRLRQRLANWCEGLSPPGLTEQPQMSATWNSYFDYYLDGKPAPPRPARTGGNRTAASDRVGNWLLRNGKLKLGQQMIHVSSRDPEGRRSPFLTRNGLKLQTPVKVHVQMSSSAGRLAVSWRTETQRDFQADCVTSIDVASEDTVQTRTLQIAGDQKVVHVRVLLPAQSQIRSIILEDANGRRERLSYGEDRR